jgi:dihydrofolate synthase/folylpolyglutamate synthase
MNYKKTLEYMYSQLPMFHRVGSVAYKANLDNTIAICNVLDNPQRKLKTIHVAGTNGKGSTSHLIASILQDSGYKVGLYTSPHLKDFRERIKINGEMIEKRFVTDFIADQKDFFLTLQPSFFEMTVGLAFSYFVNQKVDLAVIETGLGGRLDSTNVINPLLSVITNISYDHQLLLGKTLRKIAAEKAGIIKIGVPVIIGETQNEVKSVFVNKAAACKSEIYFADRYYRLKGRGHKWKTGKLYLCADAYRQSKLFMEKIYCGLSGHYQLKNISTVLMVIDLLNRSGDVITDEQIYSGIKRVIPNTGLSGRWQLLKRKPTVIADTGHNEAGIKEVLKQIKLTPHKKLHFVLGMVSDKDVMKILMLFPKTAKYYFCKPSVPRGLDQVSLKRQANNIGLNGAAYSSVSKAFKAAQSNADKSDLVFVGGSTFVVAEVI